MFLLEIKYSFPFICFDKPEVLGEGVSLRHLTLYVGFYIFVRD
jgi:hypothetical protein